MVYYNPHIAVLYNPPFIYIYICIIYPNNQGPFLRCSNVPGKIAFRRCHLRGIGHVEMHRSLDELLGLEA